MIFENTTTGTIQVILWRDNSGHIHTLIVIDLSISGLQIGRSLPLKKHAYFALGKLITNTGEIVLDVNPPKRKNLISKSMNQD